LDGGERERGMDFTGGGGGNSAVRRGGGLGWRAEGEKDEV
jgi:hypothetical protein